MPFLVRATHLEEKELNSLKKFTLMIGHDRKCFIMIYTKANTHRASHHHADKIYSAKKRCLCTISSSSHCTHLSHILIISRATLLASISLRIEWPGFYVKFLDFTPQLPSFIKEILSLADKPPRAKASAARSLLYYATYTFDDAGGKFPGWYYYTILRYSDYWNTSCLSLY